MRIRNVLILTFLVAAFLPAIMYGTWTYNEGIKREFSEVRDRHLLIAENLGNALDRYHLDLVAVTESMFNIMQTDKYSLEVKEIMSGLNIEYLYLVDADSLNIVSKIEKNHTDNTDVSIETVAALRPYLTKGKTQFTPVMVSSEGTNVMYALRDYGDKFSIARVSTKYFVELGKSISFGQKGHAAIIDSEGNVLSHPLDSWTKDRKNIAQVSAVQKMLNGETGIDFFYSPALKGDMVAGFTAIKAPKWGVMIPQPVDEIYVKVRENHRFGFLTILFAMGLTSLLVALLLNTIVTPLNKVVLDLKKNAASKELNQVKLPKSIIAVKELVDFQHNYNDMVKRIWGANSEIKKLASSDAITNLPNRFAFRRLAEEQIKNPKIAKIGGSLICIDFDNFRTINELFGHETGDKILEKLARNISNSCRFFTNEICLSHIASKIERPTVSRNSSDEFTMLVPGLTKKQDVEKFLGQLQKSLNEISEESLFSLSFSASIGCARYPADGKDFDKLIRLADIAMFEAKRSGKNCGKIYSKQLGSQTRNEIRTDFASAIGNDELILVYQPKIDTKTNEASGVEALVRWNHPRLGRLSPDLWLPAIAQTPLGIDLSNWVIGRAMQDMQWLKENGKEISFAINISADQLFEPKLLTTLQFNAKEYNIDPKFFEIEVTEDSVFKNEDVAAGVIERMHALGFSIAIDDFGTGYSNYARLAAMDIEAIKLDKSLVINAESDAKVKTIIDATVTVARALNCKVIAEGIETHQAAQFATDFGADMLQGYFYSPGITITELDLWLDQQVKQRIEAYG